MSKSIIFLVKSFLCNFDRHLAIFFWSHWWWYSVVTFLRKRCFGLDTFNFKKEIGRPKHLSWLSLMIVITADQEANIFFFQIRIWFDLATAKIFWSDAKHFRSARAGSANLGQTREKSSATDPRMTSAQIRPHIVGALKIVHTLKIELAHSRPLFSLFSSFIPTVLK